MSTQYKHKKTGIIAKLVADHHYYIFSDPNGTGSDSLAPWLIEDSCDWEKIEDKPKVILTTEDGVKITDEHQIVYLVDNNWGKMPIYARHRRTNTYNDKIFSTCQARDEYIVNNKPLLSVTEIQEMFRNTKGGVHTSLYTGLISLAKSKL